MKEKELEIDITWPILFATLSILLFGIMLALALDQNGRLIDDSALNRLCQEKYGSIYQHCYRDMGIEKSIYCCINETELPNANPPIQRYFGG